MSESARSVFARGVVQVPFDRVNFIVTISKTRPNSLEAKSAISPIVSDLETAIHELIDLGVVFNEDNTTTSVVVSQNIGSRRSGRPHGYTATFTMTLQTAHVDRASQILDMLTNVKDVQVSAPDFCVDNIEQHNEAAFTDGVARAEARFTSECKVLGKDRDSYVVSSWSVRYDDSLSSGAQPMRVAMAAGFESTGSGNDDIITIHSGKATIYANVTLHFDPVF